MLFSENQQSKKVKYPKLVIRLCKQMTTLIIIIINL